MPQGLDLLSMFDSATSDHVPTKAPHMNGTTHSSVPASIPPPQPDGFDGTDGETNAKLALVGDMFPRREGVEGRVEEEVAARSLIMRMSLLGSIRADSGATWRACGQRGRGFAGLDGCAGRACVSRGWRTVWRDSYVGYKEEGVRRARRGRPRRRADGAGGSSDDWSGGRIREVRYLRV